MINFEIFIYGLLITSTLAGLVTEAVKKILTELKVNYHSNLLAGIVALILAAGIGVVYVVICNLGFTGANVVQIIALAVLSWLGSMIGYDKVVQVITQLKNPKKG